MPLLGREVVVLEELGDEAERRQGVPQVMHEHCDVIAPLPFEQALQPERLESRPNACQELARVDGLGQVGVGSFLEPRFDRVGLPARRGQHDDGRTPATSGTKPPEHLHPAQPRHRHVEENELRLAFVDLRQGVRAVRGRAYAVTVLGEQRLVEGERVLEVVDDEHIASGIAEHGDTGTLGHERIFSWPAGAGSIALVRGATCGRTSVNTDPAASREVTSMSPPRALARRLESASPIPVPS